MEASCAFLLFNDISRTIPPIEHNGNLVFDDIETAELFNKFFCEQSTLDDSDHTSRPN
jgi:hypothetical protein